MQNRTGTVPRLTNIQERALHFILAKQAMFLPLQSKSSKKNKMRIISKSIICHHSLIIGKNDLNNKVNCSRFLHRTADSITEWVFTNDEKMKLSLVVIQKGSVHQGCSTSVHMLWGWIPAHPGRPQTSVSYCMGCCCAAKGEVATNPQAIHRLPVAQP